MPPALSRYCKFLNCTNNNSSRKHFFRFPKDIKRCKAWVKASKNPKLLGLTPEKVSAIAVLCGDHFHDWCFMDIKKRNRLVFNAVPAASKPLPQERKPVPVYYFHNREVRYIPDVFGDVSKGKHNLQSSNNKIRRRCAFKDCPITDQDEHSMFRFPTDKKRCKQWVAASGNEKLKQMSSHKLNISARLCVRHFKDWCFMNTIQRNRLVRNAVPCIEKPRYELPVRHTIKLEGQSEKNMEGMSIPNGLKIMNFNGKNVVNEESQEQDDVWTAIKSKDLRKRLIADGVNEEIVNFILYHVKLRKFEPKRKMYSVEGKECVYTIYKNTSAYVLPD